MSDKNIFSHSPAVPPDINSIKADFHFVGQ